MLQYVRDWHGARPRWLAHSNRDRALFGGRGEPRAQRVVNRSRRAFIALARYGLGGAFVAVALAATLELEGFWPDQNKTLFAFYVAFVSLVISDLVALSWDTKLRRAEKALRQERDALEAKVQERTAELERVLRVAAMTELISVTHEVSQPLTAVGTNADAALRWLAHDPPAPDQARDVLRCIAADVRRAGDVLDRIRAFSRQHTPSRVPLDINAIAHQTLTLVRGAVERQGASICTELAAALPPVAGDPVQLQQVLLNLINNGVEAMISVTDRPRLLTVRSRLDDADHVVVDVEDSGAGIDPAEIGRIFGKFYTTKPTGLGMGLPISRSIIEAHGGRLWTSSCPSHGTRFQFALPVAGTGAA